MKCNSWDCWIAWGHWLEKCDAYNFGTECRDSSGNPKYKITDEPELRRICSYDDNCETGYRDWIDQCKAEFEPGNDDTGTGTEPVADNAGTETLAGDGAGTGTETPTGDGTGTETEAPVAYDAGTTT